MMNDIRITTNAPDALRIDFNPGIYPITAEDALALKAKIETENDKTVFIEIGAASHGIISVKVNSVTAEDLAKIDVSGAICRFIRGFDQRKKA